jgi:hypothetical protein
MPDDTVGSPTHAAGAASGDEGEAASAKTPKYPTREDLGLRRFKAIDYLQRSELSSFDSYDPPACSTAFMHSLLVLCFSSKQKFVI